MPRDAKYRSNLPQLSEDDRVFLFNGALETKLIFEHGQNLPQFASFPLIKTEEGRSLLLKCTEGYIKIAKESECVQGFVLDLPTWRASPDFGKKLGMDKEELSRLMIDCGE